jgi:hypothetical protein
MPLDGHLAQPQAETRLGMHVSLTCTEGEGTTIWYKEGIYRLQTRKHHNPSRTSTVHDYVLKCMCINNNLK